MNNPVRDAKDRLRALIHAALRGAFGETPLEGGAEAIPVEIPKNTDNGDFSSSVCMACSKALGLPPRKIAERLAELLTKENDFLASCEIAGPGFLNFKLSDKWSGDVLRLVEESGADYGRVDFGGGKRVMVEFVSANPTGPMTIGNARGGVLGDALASVLDFAGYDVTREFYINDAGHQIEMFALSLEARYLQRIFGEDYCEFPENGYHGEDIRQLAFEFYTINGSSYSECDQRTRREALCQFGLEKNIRRLHDDLERYGIIYDNWYRESGLHNSGYVSETIDMLQKRGHIYESDGALWFRATSFGCDKDEVMRKQNGFFTYYAADIAYHRDKFERRGFDMAVDVFGADHHGHTIRFRAGMEALGIDPSRLRFVLMQLVRLTRDGEVVKVSKRTGKAITLSDLLDEIPRDAARFFFNNRQPDTHLEFDMALAVKQESENPVYYVQYAHARICSLLAMLRQEGVEPRRSARLDLTLLKQPEEISLIKAIAAFPEEVTVSARELEPSRINRYLAEVSASFHSFYNACRIRGQEDGLRDARLFLAWCARQVIANGLRILGVTAPEEM